MVLSRFKAFWDDLAAQERRVVTLRCKGYTRQETAEEMYIGQEAIRNHTTNFSRKAKQHLGVDASRSNRRNVVELAPICWRYGYEIGLRHERIRQCDDPPDDDGVH